MIGKTKLITLSPLARLIARSGLNTRNTLKIFIEPNVLLFFASTFPDAAMTLLQKKNQVQRK